MATTTTTTTTTAAESESENAWEEVLRKMLPAGAPLPDEDHLDYSIAVEYEGPPIPYEIPRIDPLKFNSLSIRTSSIASIDQKSDSKSIVVPSAPPISKFSRFNNGNVKKFYSSSQKQQPEEEEKEANSELDAEKRETAETAEGRRGNVVTFNTPRDSESDMDNDDEDGYSSTQSSAVAVEVRTVEGELFGVRNKKKSGICSRCGKKNRLKEREVCLVCEKRYCCNCLLKAMGSMPEGRKCVSCIGKPIDELRRSSLGKCSRILARVCSPLEVRQIMKAEKECAANQLRPEQLVVNGRQLRQEELAEVLGCALPPKKLKPGKYWYDKDSGLWGKVKNVGSLFSFLEFFVVVCVVLIVCVRIGLQEGEKPDRIISSKLNVGGKLRLDASNGNTKVYINGREINKVELRMLKVFYVVYAFRFRFFPNWHSN